MNSEALVPDTPSTIKNQTPPNSGRKSSGSQDGTQNDIEAGTVEVVVPVESEKTLTESEAPETGTIAWTQTAVGHLVVMSTWGTINSFGIFQTFYTATLSRSSSDISWIGSMQVFLLFFCSAFAGRLTDAGYFRCVFTTGSSLLVLGTLMASFSKTYWQFFLSQGVCIGLGSGCLFCPIMTVLSTYFVKRRNIAFGIAIGGSATGGVIFPLMARELLPRIGFVWTMRSIALIQMGALLIANVLVRIRAAPRPVAPLLDLSAFKEVSYSLFAIGSFFNFWGVYNAFYYIGSFSRSTFGFSYPDSITLLIIMNGAGAIGRVCPGFLADKFGPLNVITPAAYACLLLLGCWKSVSSRAGLYAFAVFYGIAGAAVQGMTPGALSCLTTDASKSGTRMGMVFSILSFATLTGPPITGMLITSENGGYKHAIAFSGICLTIGMLFLAACRISKSGFVWKIKV